MGRPTKLSDELTDQLAEVFREGQTSIESACALVGIDRSTFHRWMQRDEDEFCDFRNTIEKDRAEAVQGYLGIIQDAARKGQWQAAAWWLERVLPDQYGRKTTTEVITRDQFLETIRELERELEDAGPDT